MGCNCGKPSNPARPRPVQNSGIRQEFSLLLSGQKKIYGSRLEADAANARSGYRGIVKAVGK